MLKVKEFTGRAFIADLSRIEPVIVQTEYAEFFISESEDVPDTDRLLTPGKMYSIKVLITEIED